MDLLLVLNVFPGFNVTVGNVISFTVKLPIELFVALFPIVSLQNTFHPIYLFVAFEDQIINLHTALSLKV